MKKVRQICDHKWEPINVFRTIDGQRLLQKRCKKCCQSVYVPYEDSAENDQNGSKKKEGT